ncbi:hypothetical protein KQY10_20135 [Leptospira interrogans]|uniref:GAF domain protein n=2 Tax=Leptospira interrogans TaxID=173 RepID=A0A0F6H4S3_LEPIR|nr:hypothetical protein [Leptospira interrogans]EMF72200.1 hypothetical protein LEP1GSC148_2714 [Leptospira interrogans serovar Canicola str. LT1962]ALE41341.1 hypothetical protein G436_4204 [Leptospira interrogans serovar Hardjo str. Norma]ALO02001.1 hypothetical protein LIH_16805 [Leptospira interrogans serovar Hardjo-prajitno]EKO23207.1 hypothetical protein LEP1GSC104_0143 [Leptospira interrogans str. UI 12621]EKO87024.1 hypothetical protein LEP1GSC009_4569 [Leptospira interrogans serovar G
MLTILPESKNTNSGFKETFRSLVTDYYLISTIINLFAKGSSVLIALGIYFFILSTVPSAIEYYMEVSLLSTLIFAVFILFPLQEKFSGKLKSILISEYLSDDPRSSRLAYRKFDHEGLIKNVFPDLVRLTESNYGKLALLNNDLKTFELYTYAKKKQRKVIIHDGINPDSKLLKYILNKKNGVIIGEQDQNHEINEDFVSLRANFILPFVYRETLFGFLAVSNIPKDSVRQDLSFLSGKCGIAVHNHILSSQVAENKKYRKELETAGKIRKFLEAAEPPMIGTIRIEILSREPGELIEFLNSDGEETYFVILKLGVTNQVSVLVLCYILGTLYSAKTSRAFQSLNNIKHLVESYLKEISWNEEYDLLVGIIRKSESTISLKTSGKNFKVHKNSDFSKNLLSAGWEVEENIEKDPLVLTWKNRTMISIHDLRFPS